MLRFGWGEGEFQADDGSESFDRFKEKPSPSVEVGDCSITKLLGANLEIRKCKLVPEASE